MVTTFQRLNASGSLDALAEAGAEIEVGLRAGEADTMRQVAAGLHRYCIETGAGDDEDVRAWASRASLCAHRVH